MRKKKSEVQKEHLKWIVEKWAAQIGVKVRKINVRKMKRKWASISTAGYLTLNSELSDLPKSLCDYVIVHELLHLMAPNHSKLFKSYLHTYMPDWENREKRLNKLSDMTMNGVRSDRH